MTSADPAQRPPRGLGAINADRSLGPRAHCDPGLGAGLRALAAMRLGGVNLQLGAGCVALAAWIIDGMDITSRLLMVVDEEGRAAPARTHIGNDIRIAVHAQASLEFLHDISSRNRIDMIVLDDGSADGPLLDACMALLNPAGLLCLLCSDGGAPASMQQATELLAARNDCLLSTLHMPAPVLLAVRTPADSRPVRRGGRAARQAAERTPVVNLR